MKKYEVLKKLGAVAGGAALIAAIVKAVRNHCHSDYDDEGYADDDFDAYCDCQDGKLDAEPEEDAKCTSEDKGTAEFQDSLHQTVMAHYDKGFLDGVLLEYNGENPAAQALSVCLQAVMGLDLSKLMAGSLGGVIIKPVSGDAKTIADELQKILESQTQPMSETAKQAVEELAKIIASSVVGIRPSNKDEPAGSGKVPRDESTASEKETDGQDAESTATGEQPAEDAERRHG